MGTETADGRPELAVIDAAHAMADELRGLSDMQLEREIDHADQWLSAMTGRLETARRNTSAMCEAQGPGAVAGLEAQERLQRKEFDMAQLRYTQARGELLRREAERAAAAEHAAQVERAQRLAELRTAAWEQYQRDAGHQIDGVSLARQDVFDAAWHDYLVRTALGVVA